MQGIIINEIKPKELKKTDLKLVYEITVKNEGELAGRAEVKEEIPKGLTLIQGENKQWNIKDGIATTDTGILEPGEKKTYIVTLKWNNTMSNLGIKENKASIISTENEEGFKDVENSDDTSVASIFIGIKTGERNKILSLLISIIIILSAIEIILITKLVNIKKKYKHYPRIR